MSGAGGSVQRTWLLASGTAGRMLVHLRWTAPMLLAGSLLALLVWRPVREMEEAGGGLALWLHLPCFLWSAAVLAAGLESWPTFGRGRPGADHLLRLRLGPLHGCGAASLAVVAVQATGLAILGLAFALVTGLGPARAHLDVLPVSTDRALLTLRHPRVAFRPPAVPVQELRLRPLAFLGAAGAVPPPTAIEVLAGGTPLHRRPLLVEGSNELQRITFPARRLPDLEVRAAGEVGMPLWFGEGRVVALSASTVPAAVNGALAALTYAVPAALALSLVCLAGPWLGLAVSSLLALATLLVTTVAGWVPTGGAVHALSTGRQVLDRDFWGALLPSLPVAFLAIITAMRTRRRSTG